MESIINQSYTTANKTQNYKFMSNSKNGSFNKLLRNFPRLQYNFKDLVRTHYGYDIMKNHRQEAEYKGPILFTF